MEELRRASMVYYKACSSKQKELAKKLFDRIDSDGNGYISAEEFSNYLTKAGKPWDEDLFSKLDKDGNGSLDFDECLLYYYLVCNRPRCDGCRKLVFDMFYSCVKCFPRHIQGKSFDLCPSCHSSGNFNHDHQEFLDNYALLYSNKSQVSHGEDVGLRGINLAANVVELASNISNIAQNGCSIQ